MKTLLAIAGLDPSAGAGVLADVYVAREHDVRGMGVVTALTVQDTRGVARFVSAPLDVVEEQIQLLLVDSEISAVKIGMLGSVDMACAVALALAGTDAPVVWDPVLASSGGASLVNDIDGSATVRTLFDTLLPLCAVVTPNLDEATRLSGVAVTDPETMSEAARVLVSRGAKSVVIKGGHLASDDATDLFYDGKEETWLTDERIACGEVHGTGCVFSAALACELALGQSPVSAARRAKRYLSDRLRRPIVVGRGARCLV